MTTLAVPFVRQDSWTSCGIAVLEMVLRYKMPGQDPIKLSAMAWGSVHRARRDLKVNVNPSLGIAPNAMGDLLALLDISAVQYSFPLAKLAMADIRRAIDSGSPIVAYIQQGLHSAYGHYVLIIGYGPAATSSDPPYIELHDPAGEANKLVYHNLFPEQYYTVGGWIWGESLVLSWIV